MTPELLEDLRRDEGLRLEAYADPKSGGAPWTIGYGHTAGVKPGDTITEAEAEYELIGDVTAAERALDLLAPWWRRLDQVRQDAVTELAFNLGASKLVREFPDTMSAIKGGAFAVAGADLAADQWAKDVGPGRSGRIISMLKTGARP